MPQISPTTTAFDDFCDLLMPLGTLSSPAELHGILCGKLCGGARPSEVQWLLEAVEFLDFTQAPDESVRLALSQLYQDTCSQLRTDAFGLVLLLPGDDTDIETRVRSLGEWCQGFLSGFGSAGVPGQREISEDTEDALRDLASIVQIGDEGLDEAGSESDYMEVSEYVRMAALALYMEYADDAELAVAAAAPAPTLH